MRGTIIYSPDERFTARHHRSHCSFGAGASLAWSLEHFWLLKENLATEDRSNSQMSNNSTTQLSSQSWLEPESGEALRQSEDTPVPDLDNNQNLEGHSQRTHVGQAEPEQEGGRGQRKEQNTPSTISFSCEFVLICSQ